MSTKNDILKILEKNKGKNVSGEALAKLLGLSRAAVWKAVDTLRSDGHTIEASSGLGYMLSENSDILSVEAISKHLPGIDTQKLCLYKSIDSTNSEAKRMLINGAESGTVIISEEQTAGRGRLGRSFASPQGTGLYISFIIKLPEFNSRSLLLTLATSLCVCDAIEKTTGISGKIKWVNDIYVENKKVSGILTEAVTDFETGNIDSIVIGIGINCNTAPEQFPENVRPIAASLSEFTDPPAHVDRNLLAAALIENISKLERYPFSDNDDKLVAEYKERCFILNKKVKIIKNSSMASRAEIEKAPYVTAVDIASDGALIVRHRDGTTEHVSGGEISIRL